MHIFIGIQLDKLYRQSHLCNQHPHQGTKAHLSSPPSPAPPPARVSCLLTPSATFVPRMTLSCLPSSLIVVFVTITMSVNKFVHLQNRVVFHCGDRPQIIYPFYCWRRLSSFQVWVIMNNVALNTLIHSSWCMFMCLFVGDTAYKWTLGVIGMCNFSFITYSQCPKVVAPTDAPGMSAWYSVSLPTLQILHLSQRSQSQLTFVDRLLCARS